MISIEKYKMISPVLKRVTHNVWTFENETRKKNGETELDLFQEGFSIDECFCFTDGITTFYFACNYSFLRIFEKKLLAARKKSPELFGTGDAQHILDALYKESSQCCSEEEYCDYLRNHACCYHLRETNEELNTNILRIDLFRLLRPCEKNPNCLEFVGGLLHSLDHFSMDEQNLATGNDINEISDIDDVLVYIAKAFLECEGKKGNKIKVTINMKTGKPLNCVFYWDDKKEVYFLTTIYRAKE